MSKAAITIASLGAGLALFAMILKLQKDPFTLTSKAGVADTHDPNAQVRASEPRDPGGVALDAVRAMLGPATAVASKVGTNASGPSMARHESAVGSPGSPSVTQPPMLQEQRHSFVPCSPWRELGPKLGEIKGEGEARSVRQLC